MSRLVRRAYMTATWLLASAHKFVMSVLAPEVQPPGPSENRAPVSAAHSDLSKSSCKRRRDSEADSLRSRSHAAV